MPGLISRLRPRLQLPHLAARARLLSTLPNTPIFRALQNHDPASLAVVHSLSERSFTYGNLIGDVLRAKEQLERKTTDKLVGERVAFLAENSYDYVGKCLHTTGSVRKRLIYCSDDAGYFRE
jgi:hypothetical protein